MPGKTSIHWFRKGLRLHDNPALIAAIKADIELRPVFLVDPWVVKRRRIGANRWRFLQQSLVDLDSNLRKIGSRLFVLRGKPEDVFPRIFSEWNVQRITFELDIEPYSRERDERIEKLAQEAGVDVIQKVSHTLYNTELVLQANLGKPPMTFQKGVSTWESLGPPPDAVPPPTSLPPNCCIKDKKVLADKTHNVPTLEELGVDVDTLGPCIYPGGETEGLARLERHLAKKEWICKFEKPNTAPNGLEPTTTVLSPYLRFGCVSARTFYHKLQKVLKGRNHSKPPVSLLGQLYWREFYYVVASATPNFDRMKGNPACCQVPWDNNPDLLEAWAQGKTGYPFIDAIMRQLRQEGWIHHLARHAVACFLTRGDLYQSWEEGQKVFEELLLDADWALNAGNWMWMSASAFYHQFYRVYSPVAFGKKTDPLGEYIRKYVPEVSKFPPEYLYEPWKASLAAQRGAGCVLGEHYPRRIIIHEDVYKNNIGRLSAAYKANKLSQGGEKSQQQAGSSPAPKRKKK